MSMLDIYDISKTNRFRYTIGQSGNHPLLVLGVNPSQTTNVKVDNTVANIRSFASLLGFDSFVVLNLYPQRATDARELSLRFNKNHHHVNLEFIKQYLFSGATIWAAWGDLIETRPYLRQCLADIYEQSECYYVKWVQYDDLTKKGHPRHPARKKHEDRFRAFDIESYLGQDF